MPHVAVNIAQIWFDSADADSRCGKRC